MNVSILFARIFFLILNCLFMVVFSTAMFGGFTATNLFNGIFLGSALFFFFFGMETLFKRLNLRLFNTIAIGLFFGYLMGSAIYTVFDAFIGAVNLSLAKELSDIIKVSTYLFGTYLGMVMTIRAAEEIYVSIPFVKFRPSSRKKKDVLLDSSILADPRIIDLASSGLLDTSVVIPRFIIQELYDSTENGDEVKKAKARRCLDVIKKLEALSLLDVSYNETDFPEIKEPMEKMIRLARLLDANILTADINRIQMASAEGVRIINIHSLSNSLKPIMQAGEFIEIKVQRYGKEANQGVGYLDDGTMVVINGGGSFINDVIKAQVLSVKHTSSGRMIFCNAAEEGVELSTTESSFHHG